MPLDTEHHITLHCVPCAPTLPLLFIKVSPLQRNGSTRLKGPGHERWADAALASSHSYTAELAPHPQGFLRTPFVLTPETYSTCTITPCLFHMHPGPSAAVVAELLPIHLLQRGPVRASVSTTTLPTRRRPGPLSWGEVLSVQIVLHHSIRPCTLVCQAPGAPGAEQCQVQQAAQGSRVVRSSTAAAVRVGAGELHEGVGGRVGQGHQGLHQQHGCSREAPQHSLPREDATLYPQLAVLVACLQLLLLLLLLASVLMQLSRLSQALVQPICHILQEGLHP
eukprot:1159215-Pelagomonas_calceolata.AAC.5